MALEEQNQQQDVAGGEKSKEHQVSFHILVEL